MTTDNKHIRTPRGKSVTLRQYMALKDACNARGVEHECEYSHFACAAWDRGPCSNEVACMLYDPTKDCTECGRTSDELVDGLCAFCLKG